MASSKEYKLYNIDERIRIFLSGRNARDRKVILCNIDDLEKTLEDYFGCTFRVMLIIHGDRRTILFYTSRGDFLEYYDGIDYDKVHEGKVSTPKVCRNNFNAVAEKYSLQIREVTILDVSAENHCTDKDDSFHTAVPMFEGSGVAGVFHYIEKRLIGYPSSELRVEALLNQCSKHAIQLYYPRIQLIVNIMHFGGIPNPKVMQDLYSHFKIFKSK